MDKPDHSYEHLNEVADWIDEQARMLDQEAYPAWAENVRSKAEHLRDIAARVRVSMSDEGGENA